MKRAHHRGARLAALAGLLAAGCHMGLEVKDRSYPPELLQEVEPQGLLDEPEGAAVARLAAQLCAYFPDAPAAPPRGGAATKHPLPARAAAVDFETARRLTLVLAVPSARTLDGDELRARARARLRALLPTALAQLLNTDDRPGPLLEHELDAFLHATAVAVRGQCFRSVELWDAPFQSLEPRAVFACTLPAHPGSFRRFWAPAPRLYEETAPGPYDPHAADAALPVPPPVLFDAALEALVADYVLLPADAPGEPAALAAWLVEHRRPLLWRLATEQVLRTLAAYQRAHADDPAVARRRLDTTRDLTLLLCEGEAPALRLREQEAFYERFRLDPGTLHGVTPLVRPGTAAPDAEGIHRVHVTFPFTVNYRRAWDLCFLPPEPKVVDLSPLWAEVRAALAAAEALTGTREVDAGALAAYDGAAAPVAALALAAEWQHEAAAARYEAELRPLFMERWRAAVFEPHWAEAMAGLGGDPRFPADAPVPAALRAAALAEKAAASRVRLSGRTEDTRLHVEFRLIVPDWTAPEQRLLASEIARWALARLAAHERDALTEADVDLIVRLLGRRQTPEGDFAAYELETNDERFFATAPLCARLLAAPAGGGTPWRRVQQHADAELHLVWQAEQPGAEALPEGACVLSERPDLRATARRDPAAPRARLLLVIEGDRDVLAALATAGAPLAIAQPDGPRRGRVGEVRRMSLPLEGNIDRLEAARFRARLTVPADFPLAQFLAAAAAGYRATLAPAERAAFTTHSWRVED